MAVRHLLSSQELVHALNVWPVFAPVADVWQKPHTSDEMSLASDSVLRSRNVSVTAHRRRRRNGRSAVCDTGSTISGKGPERSNVLMICLYRAQWESTSLCCRAISLAWKESWFSSRSRQGQLGRDLGPGPRAGLNRQPAAQQRGTLLHTGEAARSRRRQDGFQIEATAPVFDLNA